MWSRRCRLLVVLLPTLFAACATEPESGCDGSASCADTGGFSFVPTKLPDTAGGAGDTGTPGSGVDVSDGEVEDATQNLPDAGGLSDAELPADEVVADVAPNPDLSSPKDIQHVQDLGPADVGPEDGGPDDVGISDIAPEDVGPDDSEAPDVGPEFPEESELPEEPDIGSTEDVPAIDTQDVSSDPCGNGILDPGEECDFGITSGAGGCPSTCIDPKGCGITTLNGEAATCSAYCKASVITTPADGDDCCPASGTPSTDSDCITCGNGKLDPGETCDDTAVGKPCATACAPPVGCSTEQLTGTAGACDVACVPDLITESIEGDDCCPIGVTEAEDLDCAAECGDGEIGPGEECEGTNLGGATCAKWGYPPNYGNPLCLPDCTLSNVPCGGHLFNYEAIPNIVLVDDFRRVRWHPTGDMALLLGTAGQVIRYDAATHTIAVSLTLAGKGVDLDVHPDGGYFLVVGTSTDGKTAKVWRLDIDLATLQPAVSDVTIALTGLPTVVTHTRDVDDPLFVIGTSAKNAGTYQNRVYLWDEEIITSKAYASSADLAGLMWIPGSSGVFSTSPAVITSEGNLGTGSRTWIVDTNIDYSNWPGGNGNAGGAEWRPGGTYGIAVGTSSAVAYVFDAGTWTKTQINQYSSGATPSAISWREDGSRAIVVGRPIVTQATVYDHRPKGPGKYVGTASWSDASIVAPTWVNASLPNFTSAPFNGGNNSSLNDVHWRPNSACDEGLIAASDNGTSFSPTLGLLIRYYDGDDPDCEPWP